MKIVVFKGGLGNQLFQYAFYKYLSRKDETFYFYNDAWYNVSHNGFELDKYFKTDDLKKCSRFWIILFKTILSKLYHWKIYDYRQLQPEKSGTGRDPAGEAETRFPSLGTG